MMNKKTLFPENDKIHRMKTRTVKKYKVQHANTERFKNSSIIAMQKMLNHDARETRIQAGAELCQAQESLDKVS